jgi:hypothetical protein
MLIKIKNKKALYKKNIQETIKKKTLTKKKEG